MKTIANGIIINSQYAKSEHLLAVIITSVFKEEIKLYLHLDEIHRSPQHWTAKTATG